MIDSMKETGKRNTVALGIGSKVNIAILATLIVGFGAVVAYFGISLITTRENLTRISLLQEADLLVASVENFMVPGEAPIAVAYFSDISVRSPVFSVALYRRGGEGAFSDDKTAIEVNRRIGTEKFPLHLDRRPVFPPPDGSAMGRGTSLPPQETIMEMDEARNGKTARIVNVYRPLVNLPKCVGCHGGDHTIRGVVRVSTDITQSVRAQQASIAISGAVFIFMVALVGAILARFMRSTVVSPVTAIGELCKNVTAGDFSGRVDYRAMDEIGVLARTVNEMTVGLRERFELGKYVSGSTITAIRGDQGSKRDHRVLLFSDIRGFTSFSESRDAETVVLSLNKALDLQARIVNSHKGDVDKFVGDEVVAVFSGPSAEERACLVALEIHRVMKESFKGAEHPLAVGIGIAAGQVIHGMIGSHTRADFTVIGDPVNTAARLCSAAKPGMTLVHAHAAKAVFDLVELSFKGPFGIALKGKKDKQVVYILGEGERHA